MDTKEYMRQAFNYLKTKNYAVVQKIENYTTNLYALPALDASYFKNGMPIEPNSIRLSTNASFEEFIEKNPNKIFNFRKDDLMGFFCFTHIYKGSELKSKSKILKNIDNLSGFNWQKNFIKIIDAISTHKHDIINNLFIIPTEVLNIKTLNLFKLNDFLIEKKLSEKELDHFYFKFFKERKIELKDEKISEKVTDFLLTRYGGNKTKLKPYLRYLSGIDEFADIQINFNNLTQVQLNMYIKNHMENNSSSGLPKTEFIAQDMASMVKRTEKLPSSRPRLKN